MRTLHGFTILTLATLAACGGGSQDAATPPAQAAPTPSIALAATSTSVTRNGSAILVRPTLTGVTGPVTWSLTPAAANDLSDFNNNLVATYFPSSATPDKVTITATAGGVSQSIQIDVKPAPALVPYVDLPAVWTKKPNSIGDEITSGGPVASAGDAAGNLYLSYAPPVSEIKKVATDGTITTFARVDNPGSLSVGPDGNLYVVDALGAAAYAIRKISPDGALSTLTRTAPYDPAKGTLDGASGTASAASLSIVAAPGGVLYATDRTRVRRIAADGSWSTVAGGGCEVPDWTGPNCGNPIDGHAGDARFRDAGNIVVDASGNLYLNDVTLVRKVTPAGDVSTLAGSPTSLDADSFAVEVDGTGKNAHFGPGYGLAIDPAGNLYRLDRGDAVLRKITPSGVASTVVRSMFFWPVNSQNTVISIYAGIPGTVVLQSSAALIKAAVN